MIPEVLVRLLLLAVAVGAGDLSLSGTVTDLVGNGVPGVGVSLMVAGLSTRTAADGSWSLPSSVDNSPRTRRKERIEWTGTALHLSLVKPSDVVVESYDLRGAALDRRTFLRVGAGDQSIPLSLPTTGVAWIRVTFGGRQEAIPVGPEFVVGKWRVVPGGRRSAGRSHAETTGGDTLIVSRDGAPLVAIPLSTTDTSGIVVRMNLDTTDPWNDTVSTFGKLYDPRDGQVYRTIRIGSRWWMAENLNFVVPDSSWWGVGLDYGRPIGTKIWDSVNAIRDKGSRFGRLYTWSAALGLPDSCNVRCCRIPDSCANARCPDLVLPPRQGVCPAGWHVPSNAEWQILLAQVEADPRVGKERSGRALKSPVGWYEEKGLSWDLLGFRVLPAGRCSGDCLQWAAGSGGHFRTSDEGTAIVATNWWFTYGTSSVSALFDFKSYGYSLRCIED